MSSDCDADSDGERLRLQEAVQGLVCGDTDREKKKKTRISKRPSATDNDHEEQHVPKDMQSFLTKKLTQFLDSQYEISTMPNASCPSQDDTQQRSVGVKLLHDSHREVSLESATTTRKRMRHDTPSDDDSDEEAKLLEAVLDADTVLKQSKAKSAH